MKIECAERLVDLVFSVSTKRGDPKWPMVPLLADECGYMDAPIPASEDLSVLGSGFAVLSSVVAEDGKPIGAADRVMSRAKLASPPEARLLARHVAQGTTIVTLDIFRARGIRSEAIGTFVVARRGDGAVVSVKKSAHGASVSIDPEMGVFLMVDPGLKIMTDASWTARLSAHDDAPSILLPTDAEGIYALFRDRTSGGGRKKALLHWVKEHVRALKDRDTIVRPHLRGVHRFSWHDTDTRISPPADSIEAMELRGRSTPSVLAAIERYRRQCGEIATEVDNANPNAA